jgi:hypothetical protein
MGFNTSLALLYAWAPKGKRARCGSNNLLLPSSIRYLAAGHGERALCRVGKLLLFGFEVLFTAVRSLEETLPYSPLDLLGDDLRLNVLAKSLHIRRHAAPNLGHLSLYTLRCLAHGLSCPFNHSIHY